MGSGGKAPYILTSALDGVEWSASRPRRFASGEVGHDINWTEKDWMPWRRKMFCPAGKRTPTVQPVASRYTDWAIPTPILKIEVETCQSNYDPISWHSGDVSDLHSGGTQFHLGTSTLVQQRFSKLVFGRQKIRILVGLRLFSPSCLRGSIQILIYRK
jgi:hypothetical protein